jgi:hypothetical protein
MVGYNGGRAGDCDHPEAVYDSEPEFVLHQEDAPLAQAALFTQDQVRRGPGRANAELLLWLALAERLATVDDLIAWNHHNQGLGTCIQGCGYRARVGLADGCRVWCDRCGMHTVCSAKDIEAGNTPGPVSTRAGDCTDNMMAEPER